MDGWMDGGGEELMGCSRALPPSRSLPTHPSSLVVRFPTPTLFSHFLPPSSASSLPPSLLLTIPPAFLLPSPSCISLLPFLDPSSLSLLLPPSSLPPLPIPSLSLPFLAPSLSLFSLLSPSSPPFSPPTPEPLSSSSRHHPCSSKLCCGDRGRNRESEKSLQQGFAVRGKSEEGKH